VCAPAAASARADLAADHIVTAHIGVGAGLNPTGLSCLLTNPLDSINVANFTGSDLTRLRTETEAALAAAASSVPAPGGIAFFAMGVAVMLHRRRR
jgi:uncharacterized protein (TIGR03382 family)